MTLRKRLFTLYVSLFSIILLGAFTAIYIIYAQFREEVFYDRLQRRITLTTKLLFEVREIDAQLMQAIDTTTIHNLYDEKLIIFDSDDKIIYSSIDDARLDYSQATLATIRTEKELRRREGDKEILGLNYVHNGREYVALASATDVTGLKMIRNLLNALMLAFGVGITLIITTSRYFIGKTLEPIVRLRDQIEGIQPSTLSKRIDAEQSSDELGSIATSFNSTLERLEQAFEFQQNFVHYASHELNTPIAVMQAIVEGLRTGQHSIEDHHKAMDQLWDVQQKVAQLLSSLLLLSSLDSTSDWSHAKHIRTDELLFEVVEEFAASHSGASISVDVDPGVHDAEQVIISGMEPLLRTALFNLLDNGLKYSSDEAISCVLTSKDGIVAISIHNHGAPVPDAMKEHIYQPFFRSPSAIGKSGRGLGLAIVKRIVDIHHGSIEYAFSQSLGNIFTISIPVYRGTEF